MFFNRFKLVSLVIVVSDVLLSTRATTNKEKPILAEDFDAAYEIKYSTSVVRNDLGCKIIMDTENSDY